MILPFSTQLNGKPTHFVEKIWKGLKQLSEAENKEISAHLTYEETIKPYVMDDEAYPKVQPKLHTIRADVKGRWQPGKLIHFVINNRQPNYYQFAPVLPCVSVQAIDIRYMPEGVNLKSFKVYVDGKRLLLPELEVLASNDGFDSVRDFMDYFNTDFTGKIIHWTNFKY